MYNLFYHLITQQHLLVDLPGGGGDYLVKVCRWEIGTFKVAMTKYD